MDYQEFVEALMDAITDKTEYNVEFHEAHEGRDKDAILVYLEEDENIISTFRFFTEECYSEWKKGTKLDALVSEVMQDADVFKRTDSVKKMQSLKDYKKVRKRLILRPVNYEKNKEELRGAFYRRVDEIALVLYMKTFAADETTMIVTVPAVYVDGWGLNEEDIFQGALQNTARMMPPRVYDFRKMILNPGYDGDDIYDSRYVPDRSELGNCLSTKTKAYGAMAIFYTDVADLFCQRMNTEELYLAFTSVHEVMVHNAKKIDDPEELCELLKETIAEATPESDFLTDHIYYYNMKKREIKMLQ